MSAAKHTPGRSEAVERIVGRIDTRLHDIGLPTYSDLIDELKAAMVLLEPLERMYQGVDLTKARAAIAKATGSAPQ